LVFKRRNPKSWMMWAREMVYPTGGFRRAIRYVSLRMRRLPDQPHRIARGVFAGWLIGCLPLPGLQFLGGWGLALLMRGNVLAALLATFNSNPVTTPLIAVGSITLGHWVLGVDTPLTASAIYTAFERAGVDLWNNFLAIFSDKTTEWAGLLDFWHTIYVPYFIGATAIGLVTALMCYYITIPLVEAYQKARAAQAKERSERRGRLRAALVEAAHRIKHRGEDRAADTPPGDA
jgi:uncharacterized protein (DUF2062 family)